MLADLAERFQEAVQAFWDARSRQQQKQIDAGKIDAGTRGAVTGGTQMGALETLLTDVLLDAGLSRTDISARTTLAIPGYYRPEKKWDLLVVAERQLLVAVEFKSQVGPSFGNNFNNRTEEAIGTAHDFWTAYRENAFGNHPRPLVAWMMLVEDASGSRRAVRDRSPHFPVFPEFVGASYLKRYDILCQRLVKEQLYSTSSIIASPRTAMDSGEFQDLSEMTSLRTFVTALAGHFATEAASCA